MDFRFSFAGVCLDSVVVRRVFLPLAQGFVVDLERIGAREADFR